jgi:hypothetical protein
MRGNNRTPRSNRPKGLWAGLSHNSTFKGLRFFAKWIEYRTFWVAAAAPGINGRGCSSVVER